MKLQITLISMILIIAICLAIFVRGFAIECDKRNSLLNEYEYVLADVWNDLTLAKAENECLKDQLGVFYTPNGCKGD